MNTHLIYSHLFYILSGPSASGKSSLTNQLLSQGLPKEAIISTDSVRKQILGSSYSIDEFGIRESLNGWEIANQPVFDIIDKMLNIRLEQKLPTIFDATNLDEATRNKYVELAKTHGVQSHIVIFNVEPEELKSRLSKRAERFDFSVVERQLSNFALESAHPYTLVQPGDKFVLVPHYINTHKIDAVGDTHGLFNETVLLLAKNGWIFENQAFYHPDKERKLLFLGDIIDRGTQSIEMLKAVYHTVLNGHGLFILGNHEEKLLRTVSQYWQQGVLRAKSLSNAKTVMDFLALETTEQKKLFNFLHNSPTHYVLWLDKHTQQAYNPLGHSPEIFKMAFGHADIDYFHPFNFPKSHALFGKRRNGSKNADELYEKGFKKGLNEHIFLRGHIPNTSKEQHIFSLEDNQAFEGHLVFLDVEKYIQRIIKNNWKGTYQFFEDNSMKYKTNFNFDKEIKDNVDFLKKMDELQKKGLVSDGWRKDEHGVKNPHPDGFKIFKYTKPVHFKKLWKTEPLLEKARGIAIDQAGNLVVHPFDKLYNYGEYEVGQGMKPDTQVQMIEKLNGFLGCISKHPFKQELLYSTTGSFNSDFVQYIKDLVTPEMEQTLLNYLSKNKETLMFEVIHPEDKHIIEYPKSDEGLWLIGARGLQFNSVIKTESELDSLAEQLNLRRPKWWTCSFADVLNLLPESQLEGYMIRDAITQEPLMKIKTNYYLVTKFVGRMGDKKVEMMYKNPEQFKANHMEEEFFPIVDEIIKRMNKAEFIALEQLPRVEFVRDIVNNLRDAVNDKKKFKI